MMTLQREYELLNEAWSIVVSKRAENAAVSASAYALCDRIAEHLSDEIFDVRMQLNIQAAMRAVFGQ